MLVYESVKKEFMSAVEDDSITDEIHDKYKLYFGKSSETQVRSWTNSLEYMYKVLNDSAIPDNTGIAVEFNIPATSKRIDFMISGLDPDSRKSCVIVELKQWDKLSKVDGCDGLVETFVGHSLKRVAHPSYQAWSYKSLLNDFNESVQENNVGLYPCAYLHNYRIKNTDGTDPLTDEIYAEYLHEAPVFVSGDVKKLREFIKKYIHTGDNREILYEIANGKIRPSKMLQDSLVRMLRGNREFIMIDDQKVVYERALRLAAVCHEHDEKRVLVVKGGPGTGKSVLAINLLVELTDSGLVTNYVTKNSAPRNVFFQKLKGSKGLSSAKNLFKGSGSYFESDKNEFDALIVDEAHRLNEKSGLFSNLGENQIKEIIHAAKFSIFFLDENQRVTLKDIGSLELIQKYAEEEGAAIEVTELESQFRCNGSDGYLAWLDHILEIRPTANPVFDIDYDFKVFDDPNELRKAIISRNTDNKARVVAGYCWDWISSGKNNKEIYDIQIPEYDFKMSWNLNNTQTWAIDPDSISEAGCIHTCQGLEFDYVGVIIGNDIRYENGHIVTDYTQRASTDQSVKGMKSLDKKDHEQAMKVADQIIKNTYRVLMTRGMKGCYVYCTDPGMRDYIKQRLSIGSL